MKTLSLFFLLTVSSLGIASLPVFPGFLKQNNTFQLSTPLKVGGSSFNAMQFVGPRQSGLGSGVVYIGNIDKDGHFTEGDIEGTYQIPISPAVNSVYVNAFDKKTSILMSLEVGKIKGVEGYSVVSSKQEVLASFEPVYRQAKEKIFPAPESGILLEPNYQSGPSSRFKSDNYALKLSRSIKLHNGEEFDLIILDSIPRTGRGLMTAHPARLKPDWTFEPVASPSAWTKDKNNNFVEPVYNFTNQLMVRSDVNNTAYAGNSNRYKELFGFNGFDVRLINIASSEYDGNIPAPGLIVDVENNLIRFPVLTEKDRREIWTRKDYEHFTNLTERKVSFEPVIHDVADVRFFKRNCAQALGNLL